MSAGMRRAHYRTLHPRFPEHDLLLAAAQLQAAAGRALAMFAPRPLSDTFAALAADPGAFELQSLRGPQHTQREKLSSE